MAIDPHPPGQRGDDHPGDGDSMHRMTAIHRPDPDLVRTGRRESIRIILEMAMRCVE
jgi:hypothetical protein